MRLVNSQVKGHPDNISESPLPSFVVWYHELISCNAKHVSLNYMLSLTQLCLKTLFNGFFFKINIYMYFVEKPGTDTGSGTSTLWYQPTPKLLYIFFIYQNYSFLLYTGIYKSHLSLKYKNKFSFYAVCKHLQFHLINFQISL